MRLEVSISTIVNVYETWPFPPAVFGNNLFFDEDDEEMDTNTVLQLLFGNSNARIIRELMHRFDRLPIHRLVYYHSYHQGVL